MTSYAETISVADLELDPYPVYRRLRRESPVAWVPAVNLWMVTRAADVEMVASRPDLFTARVADSPVDRSFGGSTVMTLDGDEHLELRRSLDAKYRPRVVATYIEDLVAPFAERFVARLQEHPDRRAELVAEYFEPISVLSLGSVLGLGHVPADTLRAWFHGLAMGAINFERDPDKQRLNDETAAWIDDELRPLMTRLRTEPDDSTIASMLTHGCPAGHARSIEQVLPSLKLIILGGMQEPGHGAASCLVGLLQNPDQLAWVREDPSRWEDAVHESLRWMAPIGTQTRQAVTDVELGGTTIPAGSMVAGVVASACRDEEVVDRPDEFDVRRERRPHAAFGYGPHFCAGHAFARAQEQIALRILLETLPDLELDESHEVEFRGWEFRAPTAVHVRW
jgi:cytochrome P450